MDQNQEIARSKHSIDSLFRYLFARKGMKVSEVAPLVGKSAAGLGGTLAHGRMNLGTLQELLDFCDEPLVLKLKNGEEIEMVLKGKKTKKPKKQLFILAIHTNTN